MNKDAYKMLESILGEENVSRDPAVLDSYIYQMFGGGSERFGPYRPACVTLPNDTKEVQAIVKCCNRYGLKFKAHSTGWGVFSNPGHENVVMIDLRRMNRLEEVNEKDMYAVVEPYVIWAHLQNAAMQKGLNCPIIGPGNGTSPLASCTAVQGISSYNISMGYNNRNILGVEWVLPDGEILRLGSLGSGGDWITGDGPGPSLRGVMRGAFGNFGGLGVFTRCAVRLYQWGGPPELPSENIIPTEELIVDYPERVKIIACGYDNLDDFASYTTKIGEEEIAYSTCLLDKGIMILGIGENNEKGIELYQAMGPQIPEFTFVVLLVANSDREMVYQEKTLLSILEQTNGIRLELLEQPGLRDMITLSLVKVGSLSAKAAFGPSGSFHPIACGFNSSPGAVYKGLDLIMETKREHLKNGLLVDDGGNGGWGPTVMEQGHIAYYENETRYCPDSDNPQSVEAWNELNRETNERLTEAKQNIPFLSQMAVSHHKGVSVHDSIAPHLNCDYRIWQRGFKNAFDPNDASDSSMYIEKE